MTVYNLFNIIEGLVWSGCAIFLWKCDKDKAPRHIRFFVPTAFLLFGISDFIECLVAPPLPWALWWMKLITGTVLYILLNFREHFFLQKFIIRKIILRTIMGIGLLMMFYMLTK